MQNKLTTLLFALILGAGSLSLAACSQDGPAEEAGENVDNATQDMQNSMENAGNEMENSMENAGNEMESSMNEAGNEMGQMGQDDESMAN